MFNKSYNIAAAERANKELLYSSIKVKVKLLDETTEVFNLSTEAKGLNLLDSVCDCLEIMERDYFGIQYKKDDEKSNSAILKWLKMNKLIRKQITTDIPSKSFYFRVRFVPSEVIQMQESYTRYQLFLQTKQDIFSSRISCPKETAIQLAGCSLQSELGDYNPTNMKPNYVGEFRFIPDQTAVFESDVAAFHKSLKGLKPEEAELQYLNTAKQLPQYGCDLYTCQLFEDQIQIGIHAYGITVFPPIAKSAYIIPWNSIEKVLNKNKCFLVKILFNQSLIAMLEGGLTQSLQKGVKADMTHTQQKVNTGLKLMFPFKDAAKEVWRNSIEMHSFFRVKDPKQIQAGGTLRRSQTIFKFQSVTNLFTGRRTLPELLDIRRRSRMMERSFSRIPSKRYNRKNTTERQSVIGSDINRPSGIIYGKQNTAPTNVTNNTKHKTQDPKVPEDQSNSDSSDFENNGNFDLNIEPGSFQPKSIVTQSVRVSNSHQSREFTKHPIIHSSMPRQKHHHHHISKSQSSINHELSPTDENAPDVMVRSVNRNEVNKSTPTASRYSVHELKTNKSQPQSTAKLSGSMSSIKNAMPNSIISMSHSSDKLFDSDTCVEIAMKPQDSKFGFTIKGGYDMKLPVIVSKVGPNSAADQCIPKLYEGDQIIKINGKFADELSNEKIKEIIRATGLMKKDNTLYLIVKPRFYFLALNRMEVRVLIRYCWKRELSTRDVTEEINDLWSISYVDADLNRLIQFTQLVKSFLIHTSLNGIVIKSDNMSIVVYLNSDDPVSPSNLSYSEDEESLPPLPPKHGFEDIRTTIKILEESLKDGSAVQVFEKLYKQKQGLTMIEAKKSDNINKNRYKDILPYDQTRIVIRNTDYINANLIKMDIQKSSNIFLNFKYIACQGPMSHTSSDFLTMVWENKAELVVMLTDLQEKGRSKCFKYWPNVGDTTKLPSGMQITCESEKFLETFCIREMKLKKSNEFRRFIHLQYINWPDHDVPAKMEDFMSFMKMLRQLRSSKSEPIIVHCSAGIGRTGVVITMDIAISYMELKQSFSVLSIVKDIRNQRAMLIQSQKQYEFVCRAIIYYFNNFSK